MSLLVILLIAAIFNLAALISNFQIQYKGCSGVLAEKEIRTDSSSEKTTS